MQLFLKLFGPHLQWFYHCFDRIVINGYLSFLTRENNVVYFFRQVKGYAQITKEILRKRTDDYQQWVKCFAVNHGIQMEWAQKGVRKEDWVGPIQKHWRRQGQWGVYFIFQSMEQGPTFRVFTPKYPTQDPDYRLVRKQQGRYTHYYFYILDPVVGAMVLRIGSFIPFGLTAYLNGHEYVERQLVAKNIAYRKEDNRFTSVEDPAALQRAANRLDGPLLQQRIDYWARIVGPKFSRKEQRACGGLRRLYAVSQIEYCRNFIFKRTWPIRSIFQRCCELSLYLLTADKIAYFFGQRLPQRLRGKLQNVLQRLEGGQHVFRTYWKNSFLKQYQKAATFLRMEIVCNQLRDLALKKTLPHWAAMRQRFQEITERFVQTQAQQLNVHGQLDVLARLAKPITQGRTKVAGIRLEHTRLLRLLEILMQGAGGHLHNWTSGHLHLTLREQYGLKSSAYTLNQLRYDLRKLRVHRLIERIPKTYNYRFTNRGYKLALLLIQLRKRVYGPMAYSQFRHQPDPQYAPHSKLEKAYHQLDKAFDRVLALLAA